MIGAEVDKADAWIVDADRCSFNPEQARFGVDCIRVMSVVGAHSAVARWRRVMSEHFEVIHEYGLLPSNQPRVVVPLGSSLQCAEALQLHRPGRLLARLVTAVASRLASMGVMCPLGGRSLCIGSRASQALPIGALQAGLDLELKNTGEDYALYLGTPDANRKTVVLPVGGLQSKIIYKMAATQESRLSLKNEAEALAALQNTVMGGNIPAILDLVEGDNTLTLQQEFRPRIAAKGNKIKPAVMDFLVRLSTIDRKARPLSDLLEEMASERKELENGFRAIFSTVWRRLEEMADEGVKIWEHRSHGDFAPWNCVWTQQGLFVFDWEASRERDVAFSDVFSFVAKPYLYVHRRTKPSKLALKAKELAAIVSSASKIPSHIIDACWMLWLLKQTHHKKDPLLLRSLELTSLQKGP